MLTNTARKAIALVLLASAAAVPLAGCQSVEEQTGLSRSTQTGALGGAAFGGIIAALAGANPAWIAASVILGGVSGGVLGNYLGKQDAERHAATNLHALDTLGEGQTSKWSNPQTGNSGSTTVTRVVVQPGGRVCKSYTETVHTSAKSVTEEATACKVPGGGWEVQHG